jgi:hypothetical protein
VSDWIEWSGGECPVAPGTLVDVKHMDGDQSYAAFAGNLVVDGVGGFDWWKHQDADCGPDGFVIAYRVVSA